MLVELLLLNASIAINAMVNEDNEKEVLRRGDFPQVFI